MALVDRTAYPRLPSAVSGQELTEVFTPTAEEVAWACAAIVEPATRLVLLVLLKCYQRLGYFPALDQVPPQVAEHIRIRAAEVVGDRIDPPGRHSERMMRRCRELVRQRTSAVWDPDRVHAVAETAMRQALQGKDNPADVINVALEALTGQGCELPAYSMLDRLAGRLRAEVNGGFHRLVAGRLDATDRGRLAELLVVDPVTRQSAWPTLTRPAGRATVSRLKQHIAFLAWLDGIGDSENWLAGLPPAKISHFAGEAAVLDVDELSRAGEDKRWTLLACVVHTARTRARDEVVTMFCKRMAAITSKAQDKLKELREEHRAESERLLGVFGDVLAGVRETLGPTETEQGAATGGEGGRRRCAGGPGGGGADRRGGRTRRADAAENLARGRRGGRVVGRARGGLGAPRQQLHPADGALLPLAPGRAVCHVGGAGPGAGQRRPYGDREVGPEYERKGPRTL